MKKICVVVGSRANYSSIKSTIKAIQTHKKLKLILVLCASAVLDKYGSIEKQIKNDGFKVDESIFTLIDGGNPVTMAKSTGLGMIELTTVFKKKKPDIVITVGDRFETMSTVLSAAYMNIPIAHTMGGEISGTIDESIRHAITKFSHIHFPASKEAYNRIIKLGENKKNVFLVGCPRIDLVKSILENKKIKDLDKAINSTGVGDKVDLSEDFLLISQHPVTTEYELASIHIQETIMALEKLKIPSIFLWPNADAGSEKMIKSIRSFRERGIKCKIRFIKNVPVDHYVHLMKKTKCLVGNSSSGIREGGYIGTPVVNIGTRQQGRERANNVIDCSNRSSAIVNAIRRQIKKKKI